MAQAGAVGQFSKYGKALGNGLIVDVASRVGNVQKAYKADGDWERELFVESSSFAASAVTGAIVVRTGAAALIFVTVATPMGWSYCYGCYGLYDGKQFSSKKWRQLVRSNYGMGKLLVSLISALGGIVFFFILISMVLYVIFGQVTVRKLRKNPETKHELGVEFASGWDIFNDMQLDT